MQHTFVGWHMKKLIIAALLIMMTQAYASQWQCEIFRINVKNDTPSTCYLIQRTINSGKVYKLQPYKIKPGTTATQFEVVENNHEQVSVVLTYECADNHTITLLSSKGRCWYQNTGKIEGIITKANNLNAVFSSKEGSYLIPQPGSILWTIS